VNATALLLELFGRVPEEVRAAVGGLDPDALVTAPEPGANPIGWLVWHLSRVGDAQIAEVAGTEQLWVTGDWARRFGLDADPEDHGYGHTADQVAAVRPESTEALLAYFDAAHQATCSYVAGLSEADLDRIVDERWDPPVTLGVRLVSVADDQIQHAGQAGYVRGLLDRRRG
jgi:hypothetical protein